MKALPSRVLFPGKRDERPGFGAKEIPHRRSVVAMGDGIVSAKWIDAYFSGVIKTSTLSPVESKPFMKAAIFSGVNALTVFS